jgi:hypothetical protein
VDWIDLGQDSDNRRAHGNEPSWLIKELSASQEGFCFHGLRISCDVIPM